MDSIIENFKGTYMLIPVLVIFAIFALLIDSKIQDYETDTHDYVKTAVIVAFVSWIAIFINTGSFKPVMDDITSGVPPF